MSQQWFLKELLFLQLTCLVLVKNYLITVICIYFGWSVLYHCSIFILMPITVLITVVCISLETQKCEFSKFVLFPKLAILNLLYFHINFSTSLPILTTNMQYLILVRIASYINLGLDPILTILIVLIHKHELHFHLFRSPFL